MIRTLRAVARSNEKVLDYLSSMVAMSKGDFRVALDRLSRARESQANAPAFQLRVANAYLELKRYDDAEACYRRALELDHDNPYAYLGLCRGALARRRHREALEAATHAVGLKFHFPAAHYFLGIARERLGDIDGAIRSFEQAVSQNPNFAEVHSRLATIYQKHVRDDERAQLHRRLARDVRQERKRVGATRIVPELPELDDAAIDQHLPEFPQAKPASLRPPLATAPDPAAQGAADEDRPMITIVSGLPRSGTSMMMQMLAAGGLRPHADDVRGADENNPLGYFECEKVKQLATDNTWLAEAGGKALKVVAPLVPYLPQECRYRVVFMHRHLDEILSSQARMLKRLDREGGNLTEARLRQVLTRQVNLVNQLLAAHGVPVLALDYVQVLAHPADAAARVAEFLGLDLDLAAMEQAVDPALHRERAPRADEANEADPATASSASSGHLTQG